MSGVMPLIYPVTCHTDYVGQGSTFVAIKGFSQAGSSFITQAIEKGAVRILIQEGEQIPDELLAFATQRQVVIERVNNTRKALAYFAASAAGYPAKKLKIVGITGTKGKTTTAYLLAHFLRRAGKRVGLVSSIANMIGEQKTDALLTTPQPDYLHQFFKACVDKQVEWVVMEVAAQAISLHRIDTIMFDALVLTNIAREHLEFYTSMDEYVEAKKQLCLHAKPGAPIWINADDPLLKDMSDVRRFGMTSNALALRGVLQETPGLGMRASIEHAGVVHAFSSRTVGGRYNLYNILAAAALSVHVGLSWQQILDGITTFNGVPGRLEQYILPNGAIAVIDYAHNPSSYEAVLSMLQTKTKRLIVLFGTGGDRDHGRRPEMGRIAAMYADHIILTSDNPRSEDPAEIVTEIYAGIPPASRHKVQVDLDRENAIHRAYDQAIPGAIIALLGKGTEAYQIVGQQKVACSEREVIRSFYRSRGLKAPI